VERPFERIQKKKTPQSKKIKKKMVEKTQTSLPFETLQIEKIQKIIEKKKKTPQKIKKKMQKIKKKNQKIEKTQKIQKSQKS
jgi:predicted transcriptional regulator